MLYIDPEKFLSLSPSHVIIDVRSPSEFSQGHMPGALNIPLYDDKERKQVGTLYKQAGRQAAILTGLDFVGPKMSQFVKLANKLAPGKEVLVHCWRGGMRSAGMAWLLKTADFNVSLLEGGYKAYRRFIRQKLEEKLNLIVLGGNTGSGKSEILNGLAGMGEQIIDLEKIAHHKGSAFGDLGQEKQPANEQFENNLFDAISKSDITKPIWIEDESRGIGKVSIPDPLYQQIRNSFIVFLDMSKSFRVKRLVREYASFDPQQLENAIHRMFQKDYATVADLLLIYYDKAYLKGLSFRDENKVFKLSVEDEDPEIIAKSVLEFFHNNKYLTDKIINYESHIS
jgi:tRNA 2-selenouridine synthase